MRTLHRSLTLTVLMLVLAAAPVLAAGPQSVYGPSAPGDAAFVRVLNLLPDPAKVSLGATRIGPVAHAVVSSYYSVVPDIYEVRVGGQSLEVVPRSGGWTTVVCTATGILALDDPPHTDAARAQLFLYNLTALPVLDLKTADGKTSVIAGVKTGTAGVVVVNAVTASLAVFNGSASVRAVGALTLARGSSWSIFALPAGAGVTLLAVKADVKVE
jgi:alginate O-acetyltransferase complex protein AlgF